MFIGVASSFTMPPPPTIFLIGLGYVGQTVMDLSPSSIAGYTNNASKPFPDAAKMCSHVVITPPILPTPDLANSLSSHFPHLETISIISSTGVYGDHQGRLVNENSETSSAHPLMEIEQSWMDNRPPNVKLRILRSAGIYGPGRSVLTPRTRNKPSTTSRRSSSASSMTITNRIHVHDLARFILKAPATEAPTVDIFNCSDDEPASRFDVMKFVRPETTAAETETSKNPLKLVDNRKMKAAPFALKYNTYREGMQSIEQCLPLN